MEYVSVCVPTPACEGVKVNPDRPLLGVLQVPPAGDTPVFRLMGGSFTQTDISTPALMAVGLTTVTMMFTELEQPVTGSEYVYFNVCDPRPAAVGLNWLPVTPVPLQVPPAGLAAGRVTSPGARQ